MSSALMCDWCGKFEDARDYNMEGTLPVGWKTIGAKREGRTYHHFHWCGECDPRKELAVKEVESE